jgi:endo-1,3(4)-beta-glucanase
LVSGPSGFTTMMKTPFMGLRAIGSWCFATLALRIVRVQLSEASTMQLIEKVALDTLDGFQSSIKVSNDIEAEELPRSNSQPITFQTLNGSVFEQDSQDTSDQQWQVSEIGLEDEQTRKFFSTSIEDNYDSASCQPPNLRASSVENIFQPINFEAPAIPVVKNHFITPKQLSRGFNPVQTNKFYANLLLSDQKQPVYCMPYVVKWTGCNETTRVCHKGIGVSHTDDDHLLYGPGEPAQYFYNPTNRHAVILSASELGNNPELRVENAGAWAITAVLSTTSQGHPFIKLPLLQGIGFITAIYSRATPTIGSLIGFQELTPIWQRQSDGTTKYSLNLVDGTKWVMYVFPSKGSSYPRFVRQSSSHTWIDEVGDFSGVIQIAKVPKGELSSSIYDKTAGTYAIDADISGSVRGTTGTYVLSWKTAGISSQNLLMFALPHHIQSMAPGTKAKLVSLSLRTTTKGSATAIISNNMTFVETSLPTNIYFYPQAPDTLANNLCLNNSTWRSFILKVAKNEIEYDINGRISREQSVYWSGKVSKILFMQYFSLTVSVNR